MNADSDDHPEVAFHPPVLLGLALVAGFIGRWLLPLSFLPERVSAVAGPALTVASLALFCWGITTMIRGGGTIPTNRSTPAIVTHGPYRYSRNPIYIAMLLLQLGVGVWANSLWFFGLAALSAYLLWWGVISREERYLESKFGETYTSYKRQVRRWL